MKKSIRKIKEERLERLRKIYSKNMAARDIAEELGCSESTAFKYIRELGLTEKRVEVVVSENEIVEKFNEGKNYTQISQELGVSKKRISVVLRKYGLGRNHFYKSEEDLIDENTQYAVDRLENIVLEKIIFNGKTYIDVAPIVSPR